MPVAETEERAVQRTRRVPKFLTEAEIEELLIRVKAALRRDLSRQHREEPGLSEEAKHFVHKF